MNVQKWPHLLNAEPDPGSCEFHSHEVFEKFPREEEKEAFRIGNAFLNCVCIFFLVIVTY